MYDMLHVQDIVELGPCYDSGRKFKVKHVSVVHNFLNSPLILIKFVSKFMVCQVLYFEAQYALRLRSLLIIRNDCKLGPGYE